MKRNSILLLACCAALLAMAKPAWSQTGESSGVGVQTPVDPELEKAQTAWRQATAEATRHHLRSVAASGDARSLLAAAMLWPQWQDDVGDGKGPAIAQEKRAWFDAARKARPRDPLVAWVEASGCVSLSDSCDRDAALRFLLKTEPNNAAVHLLAMDVADRAGQQEPAEALWQSAALARNYDARVLETGQLLYSAMSGASMPLLTPALAQSLGEVFGTSREATLEELQHVYTMAVWAALALPAYQTITRRCSADALAFLPAQRQAQCERVMELLAEDESNAVAPRIGLRKMVELAGDRTEGAAWRERLRQFYWVHESAQRSMRSSDGTLPPGYLSWLLLEGELPAMRKLLEANSLPAAPPEGWLPRQADVLALLQSADAAS